MVVAKKINNQVVDINMSGEDVMASSEDGLEVIRHSCAHLLAQAVQRLFPNVKKATGPATHNGFYYDFDSDHSFSEEDLAKIENEMIKITKESLPVKREIISRESASELFSKLNESYKVEILKTIEDDVVTIYRQGTFVDLCRGPHVPNTNCVKAFKLKDVSGAYWKHDKNNKMLQRIYGYAFDTKENLNQYLEFLKEVEKRDHRKLGRELGLIMTNDASFGATFWLPKGMVLRGIIGDFSRALHLYSGYQEIKTPTVMNRGLWEISGHWHNYRENMYSTEFEDETFLIKPMNCPGGALVYKSETRSYKDFPLRLLEFGTVFRRELSGTIHGLMRQREFTQDDAHIYISEELIESEIINVVKFVDKILSKFGFEYEVELSTRPEKFIGKLETWDFAISSLKSALKKCNISYNINEGDGAFYGPKIDYKIKDAIGRKWQCSTIQLDFNLPERFSLEYVDKDGNKKRPIMIHRAIYGSIERFIGILIEHYEGKFPLWLAPTQVVISTISEKSEKYALEIHSKLLAKNIRSELDISSDIISQKIKKAALQKIPLQLIIGENEMKNNIVNVRELGSQEALNLTLDEVISKIANA
jgi:threonyl-tRNA synthetase